MEGPDADGGSASTQERLIARCVAPTCRKVGATIHTTLACSAMMHGELSALSPYYFNSPITK